MTVKKGNTYYQDRRKERLDPILLKVLKVIDPDCCDHEICKVRWHILGKDKVYTSVFPMATIKTGEFADFKPMSRELYRECMNILKTVEVYKNARRQVVYRMNKQEKTTMES
ncbi:MAG: hypothetical protein IJV19_02660 [Prevotella sp.]|nr:hypothetical protein [Prevotella sp.]